MDNVPVTIPLERDFFVSYKGVDEAIAEWIAWQLEQDGYSVVLQKWDFRPGHNFVLKMHEATCRAGKTVLVLSRAYQEALFTRPEWSACFAEDPLGDTRRLIPVRVEDFRPDGLLKAIVWIDLADCWRTGDKQAARHRHLDGIKDARGKPDIEPPFPPCPYGVRACNPLKANDDVCPSC